MQKVASSLTWFGSSILGLANHRQYVDTCDLASNYLLICWSNDLGVLIKVVVHDVVSKLRFRPKVQFSQEQAQTGVPPSLLCCTPCARWNGSVAFMHGLAPHLHCHALPCSLRLQKYALPCSLLLPALTLCPRSLLLRSVLALLLAPSPWPPWKLLPPRSRCSGPPHSLQASSVASPPSPTSRARARRPNPSPWSPACHRRRRRRCACVAGPPRTTFGRAVATFGCGSLP